VRLTTVDLKKSQKYPKNYLFLILWNCRSFLFWQLTKQIGINSLLHHTCLCSYLSVILVSYYRCHNTYATWIFVELREYIDDIVISFSPYSLNSLFSVHPNLLYRRSVIDSVVKNTKFIFGEEYWGVYVELHMRVWDKEISFFSNLLVFELLNCAFDVTLDVTETSGARMHSEGNDCLF